MYCYSRHDAGSNHNQTLQDQVSFDGRKQQPQSPPTKVDGSVDYDGEFNHKSSCTDRCINVHQTQTYMPTAHI